MCIFKSLLFVCELCISFFTFQGRHYFSVFSSHVMNRWQFVIFPLLVLIPFLLLFFIFNTII